MKYAIEEDFDTDSDTCTLAGPEEPRSGVKDGLYYPFLKYQSKFASLISPDGQSRHVFYQAHDGSINEAQYQNPNWVTRSIAGREKVLVGTPLAAICWPGADGGKHYRLYYVSRNMHISELCFETSGNWFDGELNGKRFEINGSSDLAATCYANGKELRVYYQTDDSKLRELVHGSNGPWHPGHIFESTKVLHGSRFSFINNNEVASIHPAIRGYYQDVSGNLKEVCIDSGTSWFIGEFTEYLENTTFMTPIAATSCRCNGQAEISVFYLDGKNRIVQRGTHRTLTWQPASRISGAKKVAPGASLAASSVCRSDEEVEVQLYTTLPLNCLGQFVYRNRAWDSNPQVYGGGIIPLNAVMSMQMVVNSEYAGSIFENAGEGSSVRSRC